MMKHLPNAITCLNLFSGCVGIVSAFNGELQWSAYAILVAAILDFLDGMVARLLKAYSHIGRELDSLADMVSFGVLPSVIIYQLFQAAGAENTLLAFTAFLIAIFSALRLAKFNIDTRQSEDFIGLPTPANALLIASFPFIAGNSMGLLQEPLVLAGFSIVSGLLLVSEIRLMSLKIKSLDPAANLYRYILVFSAAILLLIFKFAAVPLIILLYFLLSFIHFRVIK